MFLDMRKAYDTVWKKGLWRRMWEIGIKGKMWRVVRNLYQSVQSCVLVNDERTDWFPVNRGLRQGCPLSPILFNIFIDGLARAIKELGRGLRVGSLEVSLLLFADDIVLLADNREAIQEMLDTAESYSRKWGFSFNCKKSAVVIRNRKEEEEHFMLGRDQVKIVKSYKYLGVEIGERYGWDEAITRLVTKAMRRVTIVSAIGIRKGLSAKAAVKMWKAVVRPVVEYAGEIWGSREWPKTERVQLEMGRKILGVSKFTASDVIRGDLGWWTLRARRDLARLTYWERLRRLGDDRLVKRIYDLGRVEYCRGNNPRSWCKDTEAIMAKYGLTSEWKTEITECQGTQWRKQLKNLIQQKEEIEWKERMIKKSKLRNYRRFKTRLEEEEYIKVEPRDLRRTITSLRSGTNQLRVERGRWKKEVLEDRICLVCDKGQIEDEEHFLVSCPAYDFERNALKYAFRKQGICQEEFNFQSLLFNGSKLATRSAQLVSKYSRDALKVRRILSDSPF